MRKNLRGWICCLYQKPMRRQIFIHLASVSHHKPLGSGINRETITEKTWRCKCVERMRHTVAQTHNNMCNWVGSSPNMLLFPLYLHWQTVVEHHGTEHSNLLSSTLCALSRVSVVSCFHYCFCLWGWIVNKTKEHTSSHLCCYELQILQNCR